MTPLARWAASSEASLLRAPRSLNEAVNWWFSNLRNTCAPVISESVREDRHGVSITCPWMVAAAAWTSLSVIVIGLGPGPGLPIAGEGRRKSEVHIGLATTD